MGFWPEQVDRRVLHRQFRAEVAVDPLHRRLFVRDSALGDEVEDVLRPVLDRRVADPRALLGDDLDHRGVQRVAGVDRRRAALDVVDVSALLADDQRPLELAHVLGVDPEVGLQRHLDLDSGRDVDEGPARPDGRVQRRQFVVVGGDDRRPVLAHQVLVLAQRRVHVGEDHALGLELLVDLVVDDLGLVLGADAGEEFALRLGDAEPVEGVFDVLRDLAPVAAVLLGSADEVVDVVPVDLAEVAAPFRGRARVEVFERLEAELAHPLRLVLVVGDRFDDLTRESLRRFVGVAGLRVVEAELLLVVGVEPCQLSFLCDYLGRCHVQSTSRVMVSSATAIGNVCTGVKAGSVFGLPVLRSKREP